MLSHKLFFCVSVELFSRAVASQVFSPLQRLTSVFGMGTGGPTALKTLTHLVCFPFVRDLYQLYHRELSLDSPLNYPEYRKRTVSAGAPPGTRTPDPLIKSQLLYQLS